MAATSSSAGGGCSAASSTLSVPTPSSAASAAAAPCAGCKFLRRKCQPDCVFAPYFPPDNQRRFANVHRVFGASNVTKLLNELQPCQREDAVNSLAYEAEMRMRDPVYGCVGVISLLQHQMRQLQGDLAAARADLAKFQSAAAAGGAALININVPVGLASAGIGYGRDQLFAVHSRDPQYRIHQELVHGYDAEFATRLGGHGVYDMGLYSGVNVAAGSFGQLGTQYMKSGTSPVADDLHPIRPA